MKYYESIEELPLYNFDKYRKKRNLNWLIVGTKSEIEKEPTQKLKEVEAKILNEYFKAMNDSVFSNKLKKWAEIEFLKMKFFSIKSILNRMHLGFADFQMEVRLLYIKELAKWGLKMPEINTKDGDLQEIMKFNSVCDGIKTKIVLIEKELEETGLAEEKSIEEQIQLVILALQYPHKITSTNTTVAEWISLVKMVESKSKQN